MNELIPYLRDVASLECQVYTQNRLLNHLYEKASALGHPINYKEPNPEYRKHTLRHTLFDFEFIGGALLIAFQGAFFIFCIEFLINLGRSKFSLKITPLCFLIFLIIMYAAAIISEQKVYRSLKKEYKKNLFQYNRAVEADKLRVEKELVVRANLTDQWHQVNAERQNTKKVLDAVYEIGVIHPKYRNLVAITSFLDYLDTGRCLSLTGPGGAYATYEDDLRFKRIETRLDVVISKLDEIISNQQYIAELMCEANATLSRIESSNNKMMKNIQKIAENSELTAYNTQCSAQNTAVMEHIMIYQTIQWS